MLKWSLRKIKSMNKELSVLGITVSILLFAITTSSVTAQNASTNASNVVGNASASVNQTASEVGANASNAMNKTGEAVNATANELGKNASDMGSTILNKTVEVGKKIVGGAATVLGNISGEMKKP
jgi:predicted PurR-regulated permease PerM